MYKSIIRYLGRLGLKYSSSYFAPLKEEIIKSNMNILFELYVGKMLFLSIIAFIINLIFTVSAFTILLKFPLLFSIPGCLLISTAIALVFLTIYHSYPYHIISSKKSNIEVNMPFAVNHLAAIASSGISPFVMFKLLSTIPEYGEITNESRRIIRNIEIFGMDVITSIKNVASRTPSDDFRHFLLGITTTIESGGDVKKYMEEAAKDALFDYRIKREKYTQTLSAYADIYTAILVAAPLFFVSVLSVMALISEGNIFGMSIPVAMQFGSYVMIPLLNAVFIIFINYTQPKV